MYNPIFVEYTQLSKYIHSLEIVVTETECDIDILAISYANFDAAGVAIELTLSESATRTLTAKCSFGQLYTIVMNGIVITGRMPESALSYATEHKLLPSVVTYTRAAAANKHDISINVRSPLKADVLGDELIISIAEDLGATAEAEEISGIRSINGIYPDDAGNISIVSVTPEISVDVL